MKNLTSKDEWPLKPRGQKPLDWVSTSNLKIPNGMMSQKVHAMRVKPAHEKEGN